MLNKQNNKEDAISLLIISFLALFLELAFIRWLPANILSLAYFSNVVLISSFLGLGLGIMISSHKRDLFLLFPIGLLIAIALFLLFRQYEIILPAKTSEWIWGYYGQNKLNPSGASIGIFSALSFVYVLITALFVAIGQKTGKLLNSFQSNKAYIINITGSLLGVVTFGLLSFLGNWFNSPLFWFIFSAVLSLWFFKKNKKLFLYSFFVVVLIFILMWFSSKDYIWSPYYSIQKKFSDDGSVMVFVNRFFHQKSVNFNSDETARLKYGLPYHLLNPNNVLILGAGTGNDAAVALLNGAKEITAVEIDPDILKLGNLHPNHPFASPYVSSIIDDARSFVKKTNKKYDMIVLGTLDSHALLSGMSTVRLDNFVYTKESLKEINHRLSENGMTVLMFSAPNQWLMEKLLGLAYEAFDHPSFVVFEDNYLFNLMIFGGPGAAGLPTQEIGNGIEIFPIEKNTATIAIPTDDWPYLYLNKKTVPSHYLKAILLLLIISFGAVIIGSRFKMEKGINGVNFFALGAAFLLLETKSITTLSLLFGSTWLVNIFVFGSILFMILIANYLLLKREIKKINIAYALLFLSLALNYFIRPNFFLQNNVWLRSVVPAFLIALPLFFSSLIFAFHIKSRKQLGSVFGVNLLGSVFGGFLEYSSMLIGLNSLYIVAGAFYLISFFAFRFCAPGLTRTAISSSGGKRFIH